jgi:hypothetical protein
MTGNESRLWVDKNVTADRILARVRGLTEVQAEAFSEPFLGKWITISGIVSTVTREREGYNVFVYRDQSSYQSIVLLFPESASGVTMLNIGDMVVTSGVIDKIRPPYLWLKDCDLTEGGPIEELREKYAHLMPPPLPRSAIDELVARTASSAPLKIDSPKTGGGRPSKVFWDDLWAEIAKQLYVGDLKPDRQADIERAMHDWITANGYSSGETQVRERARKLFILLG